MFGLGFTSERFREWRRGLDDAAKNAAFKEWKNSNTGGRLYLADTTFGDRNGKYAEAHYFRCTASNWDLRSDDYRLWRTQYRRALWCNLHNRLFKLSLALAPLGLSPYVQLWILDYLPPMSFLYYNGGVPYDANHLRKLRLFERANTAYNAYVD